MNVVKATFGLIALTLAAQPALAQGTNQAQPGASSSPQRPINSTAGNAVSTYPSNNPFKNPIGQGVPPAPSSNSARNNNQSNVPLNNR